MKNNLIFYSLTLIAVIAIPFFVKISDTKQISRDESHVVVVKPPKVHQPVPSEVTTDDPELSGLSEIQRKKFIGPNGQEKELPVEEQYTTETQDGTVLDVPVIWNLKTYSTLSELAATMTDLNTFYAEFHLNAGGRGLPEKYVLSIPSDRAVPVARDLTNYWGDLRKLPAYVWTKKNFTIISQANKRNTAVMIWEPAFVDVKDKNTPQIVVDCWDCLIVELAKLAKRHGFSQVKLYVGHEGRDGGAYWKGMSEAQFYSKIRADKTKLPWTAIDKPLPPLPEFPPSTRKTPTKPSTSSRPPRPRN